MNRGLKNYTKQITQTVGNAGTVSVNINKSDANMHMVLPILKTIGLAPIDLSIIYDHQSKDEKGLFGKGFRLNFNSKIIDEGSGVIKIRNADGSVDKYINGEQNKETQLTTSIVKDSYSIFQGCTVKDKQGNITEYSAACLDYPSKIKTKTETMTLDFIKNYPTIENGHGDLVRFIVTGNKVKSVVYSRGEAAVLIVELEYDSSDRLSKLIYTDSTGRTNTEFALNSTSIIYGANTIALKDNISTKSIKVTFNSYGEVITVEEGYGDVFLKDRNITISYSNNKTTVSNANNVNITYFFDSNGLPLYQIDSQGAVIETEFDDTTKRLLAKSSPALARCINTIYSGKASYFLKSGVSVADKSCDDEILKKYVDTVSAVKGTGTLTYTIHYSGMPDESIMAIIWGKQLKELSQGKVSVSLTVGNETDTDFFKKTTVDSNFDFISLGVTANKTFSKIVMQIKLENDTEIDLAGIHILKKKYGTVYKYDEYGNCTEVENVGKTMALRYNAKNLLTSVIGEDSSYTQNEYNDRNKVERSITAFGTIITNVYDDFNHIVKTTMQTADNSIIMENSKVYTADGRFVETVTNELNKSTKFTYDSYGRVIKVLDALGVVSESIYADNGLLKKLLIGNGTQSATYSYNKYRQIKSIVLSGDRVYDLVYDDNHNLADILLNDTVLYQFEYDAFGNITAEKYGLNSGKMLFEYDNFGNIIKVNYLAPNKSKKLLKYIYEYDSLQRLTKVMDGAGNELIKYVYDHDGNCIKEIVSNSSLDNSYDVKGNIIFQKRNYGNKTIYQSFEQADRSRSECPQSLTECFGKDNYLCLFEGHAVLTKGNETIIPKVTDERILNIKRDGFLPFINTWSSQLSYTFNESFSNKEFSVQFWFKLESLSRAGHLFYCKSSNGSVIQVYYQNNRLVLYAGGNEIRSLNQVTEGWNFLSLNVVKENGKHSYCLTLNGRTTINTSLSAFDFGINPQFFIGSSPSNTYNFRGEIACMMISIGKSMPQKEIFDFYRISKDYIIEKSNDDNKCVDFSETVVYTTNNVITTDYDIFPLHNSYVSLKGTIPYFAEKNVGSQLDKDRSFHFNLLSRNYAYVADGSQLVYRFNHTNEGTIMMRAYIDRNVGKQYFFEGKDSQGSKLGLYKESDGKVYVDLKDTVINTGLTFEEGKWHTIGLAFGTEVTSTSLSTTSTRKLRVYLDDDLYDTVAKKSFDFTGLYYSIGRTVDIIIDNTSLNGSECYPLYGQIEMLAEDSNYYSSITTKYLATQLNNISQVTARDELGMLKRKSIHRSGHGILSKTIDYKKRSKNSKYMSKVVSAENIWINYQQTKRTYDTDDLGRVKSITDGTFGGHTYEYDTCGRVIKDDGKVIAYDKDGNITNLCGIGMEYNNCLRNLITKAAGFVVSYDDPDPNLITGWKSKYFRYFRNQLTEFGLGSTSYKYTYNHLGQRISKAGPQGTTQYVYSGIKLLTEITPSYKLDFLYDENDELFGFIKDNDTKYFYVKDILGNVIGIVDENGTLVAKYSYAAFGNTTITLNQSGIASVNPFRFKCCYQDDESGMYCINGRYYIPEWGRWLTLDKESIDFTSVGKENPFGLNTLCLVTSNLGTELATYTVPDNIFTKFRPHWEWEWFATNGPSFGKVTNEGIVIVDGSVSIFKATFAFDENKERSIYYSIGNLEDYLGAHYDKGIGLNMGVSVAAIGFDGKYIDAEVSMLTFGGGVIFQDGKIKVNLAPGWIGFTLSVDIKNIMEQLFGG